MVNISNNGGNEVQKHQTVQIEQGFGFSSDSDDFVRGEIRDELRKINTKMEKMIDCFYRMMHDRGKQLNHSFNGGPRELGDVGIQEHGGGFENQNLQGRFDSQFEGSSMESEASHQPLMVDLNVNCFSEASRQQTDNKSEILEAKIQAMWNLVNRSQIENGGMRNSHPIATSDIMQDEIHRAIGNSEFQLSGFMVNNLEINCEYANFEENMAEVESNEVLIETEEDLVKAEVLLVVKEHAIGINCGAVQNLGKEVPKEIGDEIEIGINCGAVYAKIEIGDESYDVENEEVKMSENGAAKNGMLQIIFNDPFYNAIKSVLVNDKMHLLLAVRIAIPRVEVKGWLAFECEVCRLMLRSQGICAAAGIGAQWWRQGVG